MLKVTQIIIMSMVYLLKFVDSLRFNQHSDVFDVQNHMVTSSILNQITYVFLGLSVSKLKTDIMCPYYLIYNTSLYGFYYSGI